MSDNKKGEKKRKPEKYILYVGEDDGYWSSLCHRIQSKFEKTVFEFRHVQMNQFENYQDLFLEILDYRPGFVYLDFATDQSPMLKLANLVKLENSLKNMPVVGLVDKKEKVEECIFAGVDVIHVKCGEFHDVVYDPYVLAFPKEAPEIKFARAKFEKEVSLIADFRIGYITPTYIHAEGDMDIEEGAIIQLNTNIPKNMVPSRHYRVRSVDNKNLYYQYRYCYDLEFIYVDEPEDEVAKVEEEMIGASEEQREIVLKEAKKNQQYKMAEYKSALEQSKKSVHDWVVHNLTDSKAKKTKIMIVDPKLDFVRNTTKNLDRYPFIIRLQTKLSDDFYELCHTRPDIVAMQFYCSKDLVRQMEKSYDRYTHEDGTPLTEDEVVEEKERALKILKKQEESKALDTLSLMIKKIKELEDYRPFIIIFNCENYGSNAIQDSLKYPFVIAHKGSFSFTTVTDMAMAFERKNDKKFEDYVATKIQQLKKSNPTKYRKLKASDFAEKRYYVSRNDAISRANYRYPITLLELTESDCSFYCEKILKLDTYRLDFPVEMSVTLIPFAGGEREKTGDGYLYKALIHSVGEGEKRDLRRYINEIFFSDLNEKRQAEKEAFENLNATERQKRLEEMEKEKKEQEERMRDALEKEEVREADASSRTGEGENEKDD